MCVCSYACMDGCMHICKHMLVYRYIERERELYGSKFELYGSFDIPWL